MALTESELVTALAVIMHNHARGTIAPTFAAVANKLSALYGEAAVKNREGVLRECYDNFNAEAIQFKRTVIVEGDELEEVFEDALEAPAQRAAPVKRERKGPTIYLLSPDMAAFCGKLNASKAEVERAIVEHAKEKGLYLDPVNEKRMLEINLIPSSESQSIDSRTERKQLQTDEKNQKLHFPCDLV